MLTYSNQFHAIIEQAKDLYYAGKYQEALSLLDQTMQLIESQEQKLSQDGSNPVVISQKLEYMSLYFAVQSIFLHNLSVSSTIDLLESKLEKAENSTSYYFDIKDLLGLALYYEEISNQDPDLEQAINHLTEVYQYRKDSLSDDLAMSHFHLGLVYQASGNTAKALDHFIDADEMANKSDDDFLRSFTTRHLGLIYQQTDEIIQATQYLEISLKLRLDNDLLVYVPFSCITLADIYLIQDKQDRAEQLYGQAITIAEMIGLDRALALSYLSQGKFYEYLDNSENALQSYLDSYYFGRKINHEGIMDHILSRLQLDLK